VPINTVVDTNTFVSAILSTSSIPAQAVDKAFRMGPVLRSVDTWHELEDVLLRKKFDKFQAAELRREYLEFLNGALEMISVRSTLRVCRDPNDDKFLELAIDGLADFIVTGDDDLLELHPFRGIAIMTPMAYLNEPVS